MGILNSIVNAALEIGSGMLSSMAGKAAGCAKSGTCQGKRLSDEQREYLAGQVDVCNKYADKLRDIKNQREMDED